MSGPTILPFSGTAVSRAADAIRAGGIVAAATETVYGLAADARSSAAVARIYAAKGRPDFNPLIVHVADAGAAERIALFDEQARALAAAFWPGPLTLVLPLAGGAGIAPAVTAGLATVAVRVPRGRAMRALIEASGCPLAAPSANRSEGVSPTTAAHVAASLREAAPLILDDGPCAAGLESTVVGRTGENWSVLRPGPVTAEALSAHVLLSDARPTGITAPGQLARHYAPGRPVRLDATEARAGEWLIGYGPVGGHDTLSAVGDPWEAASRLFACLHRGDASGAARIAVAPVPHAGVGAAINDRLRRAAAS